MKKTSNRIFSKRCSFAAVIITIPLFCWSQVFSSGKPFFCPTTDTLTVPEITLHTSNFQEMSSKTDSLHFKDQVFAVSIDVTINPEEFGSWYSLPKQNKRIWLMSIKAPKAASINLILNPFNLLPGAKLFFYDSTQSQILGAITFLNNKTSNILPLSIIHSDKVYCELQMPIYSKEYGYFTISQVNVEPQSGIQLKSTQDKYFGRSQSCNVNVNCIHSSIIQTQKNAVCRIVYSGTKRCSGTLINNIENDGTPYVLTAAHCINTEYLANTAVVYFRYESPTCENIDGLNYSVSGATLVAAGNHIPGIYDSLDFALIKLSEIPPIEYLPFYSGWDASGIYPDSTYTIHHPQGDIKKISFDADVPSVTSFDSFEENTHWQIIDYTYGTSEAGSSGSGLINQNGRLIGTLSAGGDACSDFIYDDYQQFSHSFNDYQNSTCQLKKWLDPKNSGKLICNGYYANGTLRDSAVVLSNYTSYDSLLIQKNNTGWGYASGHNYQHNTLFAEHLKIKGSKYLYGANIIPALTYQNSNDQKVVFFVCRGGDTPGETIYSKEISLSLIDPGYPYKIDFDSTLLVSGDFYFGYKIEYSSDTFAVKTVATDANANTALTYLDGQWRPLQLNGSAISAHLAVEVLAFNLMPQKDLLVDTAEWSNVSIYPNPAKDQIQVFIKDENANDITMNLYDLCGRLLINEHYTEFIPNIPFQLEVEKGIYILQIKTNSGKSKAFKVLVE
jgi:lysyl endopeptidase